MTRRYMALIAVLLVAIWTAAWMPVSPLSTQLEEHPRGCHGHDGVPASDHRCCLSGHDVAAPVTSHTQRPSCRGECFSFDVPTSSLTVVPSSESTLTNRCGDPPVLGPVRLASLRI